MVSLSLSITISRHPSASMNIESRSTPPSPSPPSQTHHQTPSEPSPSQTFIPPSPHRSSTTKYKYKYHNPTSGVVTRSNKQGGVVVLPPRYSFASSKPGTPRIDESFEDLLEDRESVGVVEEQRERRGRRKMGDSNSNSKDLVTGMDVERRKSYGIGGAGNIRRPSDIIYPPRLNPGGTPCRSSVWSVGGSGANPNSKRRWSWFGLRNSNNISTSGEDVK